MIKVAVISKTPDNWENKEASLESDALYEKLRIALLNLSREETLWLITPLNRGLETMAATLALKIGEKVKLECAIPFEEQAKDWAESERDRYFDIIEKCDKENIITYKKFDKSERLCYSYLINEADLILLGTPPSDDIAELINNSGKKIIEM
ncbi:MAG: DUF1273 family protein [Clostridia bacterium]|nr:DUF1273 family protein [Clostridia bacterium]